MRRQAIYGGNGSYFKITDYGAVLRDAMLLARFKPDLVILDEAQRIENFSTKTADAVKSIPRRHAVVLTGKPLANRLEDVYSIVQFLDPHLLSPLWRFAAEHFMLSRHKKGNILRYRKLDRLHVQLNPLVLRRRKEEVLRELPKELVNNYYLDLHHQQQKIHSGYLQALIDEFNANPKCRVFLSTDAGGTGLNLQAADCVVNFELPWNPARVRQRVGRVSRIGQKSRCINVVNLITKNSIEEKILAGLQLKTDLFAEVFDGGADTVQNFKSPPRFDSSPYTQFHDHHLFKVQTRE